MSKRDLKICPCINKGYIGRKAFFRLCDKCQNRHRFLSTINGATESSYYYGNEYGHGVLKFYDVYDAHYGENKFIKEIANSIPM